MQKGNIEVIEYLLDEKGEDVNSVNEFNGSTCLHYLAMGQHEDHIRTLVGRGADHKKTDTSGKLPAHVLIQAQSQSQSETLETMLQVISQMEEEE